MRLMIALLIGAALGSHTHANAAANTHAPSGGASSPYTIAERGPHYRVWKSVVSHTNAAGKIIYHTNSFREMATGMHQRRNGKWVEADDTIQLAADGSAAFATNTQHAVRFANNLHLAGAIQLVTPGGHLLQSSVLGLCYEDTSTGSRAVLANCTDAIGQLLPSLHQVIYAGALVSSNSSFHADVLYTHQRNRFEQDIILRQQPPLPQDFGLNPTSTVLQVWTEFYNTPEPKVSARTRTLNLANGKKHLLQDEKLNFGAMEMGNGNAFVSGGSTNAASAEANGILLVPVSKRWIHAQGRTFLVEEVPLDAIAAQLNALPPSTSFNGAPSGSGSSASQAFFQPLPKMAQKPKAKAQPMRLAKLESKEQPGFLMDYDLINASETNFTFQSDTTYYMSGECDFYGTTTVEGGTVIKCAPSDSGNAVWEGDVNWLTSAYRPAIFTCYDDDSVGVALPDSSGSPQLAVTTYLYVPNGGLLHDARFSYAFNAYSGGAEDVEISDCQFINCSHPITVNSTTTNLGLHNVLLTMSDTINQGVGSEFAITVYPYNLNVYGEHVTADLQSHDFLKNSFGTVNSLNLTNSIILATNLVNPGTITTHTNLVYYSHINPGTLFQSIGAGNYYLVTNSPCRTNGTTNIIKSTLADIQQKTTWPPIVLLSNTFTMPTVLAPEVGRDNGSVVDLGYHYSPIDFLLGFCTVSNAPLTLTNGVVVGYSDNYNLWMQDNSSLVSQGSPTQRNYLAHYSMVQEQPTNLWSAFGWDKGRPFIPYANNKNNSPPISLRFTTICLANGSVDLFDSWDGGQTPASLFLRDCEFYACGAKFSQTVPSSAPPLSLINNLFHRVEVELDTEAGAPLTNYNNHFLGTNQSVLIYNYASPAMGMTGKNVVSSNNVFDNDISVYLEGACDYNAYINGAICGQGLNAHDIVTNLIWQTGRLGFYYQPTNSPLINMGSIHADQLGLYHFTTQVSQIKETNSTVDIGYHYVALGTNGLPVSTSGDGLGDYLKDSNGDGVYEPFVDLGNWQVSSTCGDGISDAVKFAQGRNLNTCTTVPDTNGVLNLQVYTPLK